jgi:mannonate dehydratase
MADSPAWGVLLCIGTVSEMGGEAAVNDMIDTFAPAGRIGYVHFRDVEGRVEHFHETFLGAGNYDPVRVMRRLRGAGYDGFIMDDHVPVMDGDDERQRISHAFAMGYLHALIRATDNA